MSIFFSKICCFWTEFKQSILWIFWVIPCAWASPSLMILHWWALSPFVFWGSSCLSPDFVFICLLVTESRAVSGQLTFVLRYTFLAQILFSLNPWSTFLFGLVSSILWDCEVSMHWVVIQVYRLPSRVWLSFGWVGPVSWWINKWFDLYFFMWILERHTLF